MAEGLDSHAQEAMEENRILRDQHKVAAERLQEAEKIAETLQNQRAMTELAGSIGAEDSIPRIDPEHVQVAENVAAMEKDRLETHLKMSGMAASENQDVLEAQAKVEMEADFAQRQSAENPEGS